jgi:tRNA (guanine37-N1)-methyltransferase
MKITILTLFPEMFTGILTNSIIKRAIAKNIVTIDIVNIRDFTLDKYNRVDTPPIGGGAGLVMKVQPIVDTLKSLEPGYKLLLSPRGKTFDQDLAKLLSQKDHVILICGHYEGVDERVNNYVDGLVSIGDYIMTGGEIGAMAITDAVVRLLDGAIDEESLVEESFTNGLLEYPQYTEPYTFDNYEVPLILYSGNHDAIRKWRLKQSLLLTKKYRPDLFAKHNLTKEETILLNEDENPQWLMDAIKKGEKFTKKD